MSLPTFIAIEAATDEIASFPVGIAWSLPDGSIKHVLILPDEAWLDDVEDQPMVRDMGLGVESYSVDEVVRELLYDQQDDVYYLDQLQPQEGWLLKLFDAAGQEVGFELVEARELCAGDDWSQAYLEAQQFLGLDPTRAEDQVRALLEAHVRLTGDQPD